MGLSLRPLGRKIEDIFSADTRADQQRRQAAKQPRFYADQQRAMGNKRPATNPGAQFLGQTARMANTAKAGVRELADTARMITADVTDNPEAFRSVNEANQRFKQRAYQPDSGIFGAGTLYDKPEEFNTLGAADLTKRVAAMTLGTAGELLPVGRGMPVAKKGLGVVPKLAGQGAAVASVGNVGDQFIQTGKVDPKQVAMSAGFGAVTAAAPPVAFAGGKQVVKGVRELPRVAAKADELAFTPRGQNRLNLEDKAALEGFIDVQRGIIEKPSERSAVLKNAKGAAERQGVKLYPGDGSVPADNVEQFLNSRKQVRQGGYVQLPGEKPKVTAKTPESVVPARPPTVTMKPRGFAQNLAKDAGNPTADTVIEAMPGYKPITNKQTLTKAANEITQDKNAAFARVATKPQLTSANDVATGNLLLRDAIEQGDIESAIQLGTKLGIDGTKLGQAVQAYATWKKTTPEGILRYATKKSARGGQELNPEIGRELVEKAKAIADMPESLERAKATRELLGQADQLGRNWTDTLKEVLSTPRAAMATADLSAPLRQGAVLGSRFPKQWAKAAVESVKFMARPGEYEKAMYEISQRPSYALMKSRKLAVDAVENLTGTEEQFMGNFLESKLAKRLGIGHVVAASDRAYSGFLTKLRADVFDKVLDDSKAAGVELDNKSLNSLAKFINSASGRGDGNVTRQLSKLQVLFSPRLWKSRLDVLNPAYYGRLDPVARKYALQSAAAFGSIATTVVGLAALAGADVENDPRSSDFAKIKVGNTRYDILGGLQQNIRLAAQLATGEKINSVTGELQTLGPERGFGKPSRLDLLYQFIENKENPAIAFGTKVLRGTDPVGNPINPAAEASKLFIPLTAQSVYETAKDQGIAKGALMNIPGTFGVGVQTYGKDKAPPEKKTEEKFTEKKEAFKKSGDNLKVEGDKVLRRRKDGSIQVTPKLNYDYSLGQNKLQAAKRSENMDEWFKIADSQFKNLQKQLKDKSLDELERSNIEEKLIRLQSEADKYQEQGGFTKVKGGRKASRSGGGGGGRSGGSTSVGSPFKYAVSASAGGVSVKPKVSVKSSRGVKSTVKKASQPKVSLKKSRA